MGLGGFSSIVVVDASGRVVAKLGDAPADAPLEGPGVERQELPGGGYLVARRHNVGAVWSRYARAFIHEARSPLNALAIYLELLSSRVVEPGPGERPEARPTRILEKANEQIRRVEDLLRFFGELWGTRGEHTNLSEMVGAISRFSEHEALRHGLRYSASVAPQLEIEPHPGRVADALVLLMGAVFRAPSETAIHVTLAPKGERAVTLSVSIEGPNVNAADLLRPGADALRGLGAQVEQDGPRVAAVFPRRAS